MSDIEGGGTRVGFAGLGRMGAPMVRALVRGGVKPVLNDTDASAMQGLADELSLTTVAQAADLAEQADLIILMLPNSRIVEAVVAPDAKDGLAARLSAGSIIVDMSSSDPMATRELGAALAPRGITLLDAPVSGGVRKAVSAELAIMLGGDDDDALDRAEAVLGHMGRVFRTGPLASGHATKALNNYVSAAGLAAACEAVIVGREFGLDPERIIEVINASTGRNNSTENKIRQFVLNGAFDKAGFALDLMAKDVGLAASLARAMGRDLPGLSAAGALWAQAQKDLGPGADHTEIYRYLAARGADDES